MAKIQLDVGYVKGELSLVLENVLLLCCAEQWPTGLLEATEKQVGIRRWRITDRFYNSFEYLKV